MGGFVELSRVAATSILQSLTINHQTDPCDSITLATFRNELMLVPASRSPLVLNSLAVALTSSNTSVVAASTRASSVSPAP